MKITEGFVKDILKSEFQDLHQSIFDNSFLLQYLDKKMKAVHGDCLYEY